jgi:hypothetical protein
MASITGSVISICKPTSTNSHSASTWRFYPFNAFRSLLGIAGDVTGPTYAELYSGAWQHPTCWGVVDNRIGKVPSLDIADWRS